MGQRDRTHLFISPSPTNEAFQQVVGGGPSGAGPLPPDRRKHGLGRATEATWGEDGDRQFATVFIPRGKKSYFLEKLAAYIESADDEKPQNAPPVEGIQRIRRATIKDLWTDPFVDYPSDPKATVWWEVWLCNHGKTQRSALERSHASTTFGWGNMRWVSTIGAWCSFEPAQMNYLAHCPCLTTSLNCGGPMSPRRSWPPCPRPIRQNG